MNKSEFIDELFDMYCVSEFDYEILYRKYVNGVFENINYQELLNSIDNTKPQFLPSPQELNKLAEKHNLKNSTISKCEALQIINRDKQIQRIAMKDFDKELKNKIRNFLGKYNKKPSFDM